MLERNLKWLEYVDPVLFASYKDSQYRPSSTSSLEYFHLDYDSCDGQTCKTYISPVSFADQNKNLAPATSKSNFLIVGGFGSLAPHAHSNFRYMVLIERDPSVFYSTFGHIDWPKMTKGRKVFLHVGPIEPTTLKHKINQFLMDHGIHNATSIAYTGRDTQAISTACTSIKEVVQSLGFYDDERVGMAHTVHKLRNNGTFLTPPRTSYAQGRPALVCGNGPSIIASLPLIRAHRDKVVLVACASTIATLCANGIKPDVFVFQERPKVCAQFVKERTTPEFRQNITYIGLNTIHPDMGDLFPHRHYYVMKDNDFGAMLGSYYAPQATHLRYINPMGVNAGVAIMSELGFSTIYIAGTDCCFSEEGRSHGHGNAMEVKMGKPMEFAGNFRPKVTTDASYLWSAQALAQVAKDHPEIAYYNLSDGMKIYGYKPVRDIGTHSCGEWDLSPYFAPASTQVDLDEIRVAFVSYMDQLVSKLRVGDLDQMHYIMEQLRQQAPRFWHLVKGTIYTQMMFMHHARLHGGFGRSVEIFSDLLRAMHRDIQMRLFDLDDWDEFPT